MIWQACLMAWTVLCTRWTQAEGACDPELNAESAFSPPLSSSDTSSDDADDDTLSDGVEAAFAAMTKLLTEQVRAALPAPPAESGSNVRLRAARTTCLL